MAEIILLEQETIDKIAAGEVIERPSSVVKELVENAMDAKATAVTVEIKDGGISLIRITDNGSGIAKDQVSMAFLRHSTSKIKTIEDLLTVSSLGFRGEALSSIAAVAQVELITKTAESLTGVRYVIEGSLEKEKEEIGAPDGTTFLVRNLFYNTPARRKFLKAAQTEAGYIHTLVERLALSRPDISFKLIVNNQIKLHTSGNSSVKDVIYQIFGREMASSLLAVEEENELFQVTGFIGNPSVSRGNRNFENYFINQRYIKSSLISKSLEDGYKNFLMQRQYPFCVLYFQFAAELLDVNVHPSKMELRFDRKEEIYQKLFTCIREKLTNREHIRTVSISRVKEKEEKITPRRKTLPEPFEKERLKKLADSLKKDSPYETKYPQHTQRPCEARGLESAQTSCEAKDSQTAQASCEAKSLQTAQTSCEAKSPQTAQKPYEAKGSQTAQASCKAKSLQTAQTSYEAKSLQTAQKPYEAKGSQIAQAPHGEKASESVQAFHQARDAEYVQEEISYNGRFLSEQAKKQHKIIGQVFETYWLVEYDEKLFIIDQHAAHEKVLYEKTIKSLKEKEYTISPPLILALDHQEIQALTMVSGQLTDLGFKIEPFGGKEYAISGVPGNLFGLNARQVLLEILDSWEEMKRISAPELLLEKIASISCKAAVKGNSKLTAREAETLISELLELENPYFCPHGRPTIIAMDKYELEKKFKRIV